MSDEDLFCELPNGIRLCYRTDGAASGRPLLLVSGLALDLTCWPPSLIAGLVAAGFYVVRFDNRDAGRSTHVDAPAPSKLRQALAITRADDYDLGDMADDTLGLLDQLGIAHVDLVGMSMGGMIAQIVAARAPERVHSLTSIFSTTGDPKVGQASKATLLSMAKPSSRTGAVSARRHIRSLRRWGSPVFGFDPRVEEDWALTVWERGGGRAASRGAARQVSALQKSGDRTAQVRTISVPTLVVHGDHDPMIDPSGGDATAAAIPGARRVTIQGMRHHLVAGAMPELTGLIAEHAKGVSRVG